MPTEDTLGTGAAPAVETHPITPPVDAAAIEAPGTPAPIAPAAKEEPKAPATFEEYNKALEAEIDKDEEPEAAADEPKADEKDESKEADTPADDAVVLFEDADDWAATQEKRKAYLEAVEITPELQTILDRQDAEIARLATGVADLPASPETVKELVLAFDQLFEMVPAGEGSTELIANTQPVVDLFRTKYANEFEPLAAAILASDSPKYKGASMMEHFIVDTFGEEKAKNMFAYAHANIPLPVVPAGASLPEGISETLGEAYSKLPEVKRFEIESLVADVRDLEERLKDSSEYMRGDLEQELKAKRDRLNGEIYTLDAIQSKLSGDRERTERETRQRTEQTAAFVNKVNTEYNTEIFGMADTFIADLAPRLSFADQSVQPALARDINTRVFNALAFTIHENGSYSPDPMADYYAKQLTEEGVKFDFNAGRDLLKQHHTATAQLIALQSQQNVSPQAIERAQAKKKAVMMQIKANQVDLLGQISSRYVKGVAKGIGDQTKKEMEKKQAVRPRIGGAGAGNNGRSTKPVSQSIQDYNREQARKIKDGDDLFDEYAG